VEIKWRTIAQRIKGEKEKYTATWFRNVLSNAIFLKMTDTLNIHIVNHRISTKKTKEGCIINKTTQIKWGTKQILKPQEGRKRKKGEME
jgi:hypothetical protein